MGVAVRLAASLALLGSVPACASYSPSEVANPTDLTVDEAMADIGKGFARLREELDRAPQALRLGLYACRVEVALNVTANAAQGGKLVLDASIKPPMKVVEAGVTVQGTQENTSSAARGNTVTVVLENPTCALLAGLAGKVAPTTPAPAAGGGGAGAGTPRPGPAAAVDKAPFATSEEVKKTIRVIVEEAPYKIMRRDLPFAPD